MPAPTLTGTWQNLHYSDGATRGAGGVRLIWVPDVAYDTLALNLIWTFYNFMMLG